MNTELKDKVVLITGASGGIGSATARAFAEEGARLVLHTHSKPERLKALSAEFAETESIRVQADLTTEAGVKKIFRTAIKKYGRADVLIANAGKWELQDVPLHAMSLKQWRSTLDGVLTATFLCMREFFKIVAAQKQGNAVMIGSTAAIFGEANHADYAAAKAAMTHGLTRTLKNEIVRLAPHTETYCGGRVNCICPGWTVVPRNADKLKNHAMVKRVVATMALPQIGRPEDMAQAAVFLASDKLSRHITGQILTIAGGMEGRTLWQPEEINAELA